MAEKIADNAKKIKQNKVLPYLVSKVVEVSAITPFLSTPLPPVHATSGVLQGKR